MKFQLLLLVSFACVLAVRADETPEAKPETVEEPKSDVPEKCQKCNCNAEGSDAACEKHHGHSHDKTPETASDQGEDTCKPGEMFKNDCNDCKCPDSGRKSEAACTIMACP